MALRQTVAPAAEPVTTADAKFHLRADSADENSYIDGLIATARQHAEDFTGRQFVTATWQLKLDRLPGGGEIYADGEFRKYRYDWPVILVPRPRLQSVSSIQYVDTNGATQTLATSEYTVDASAEPGRIVPAYGKTWPATRDVPNAVTITFVAGYGNAAAVPEPIKSAIKLGLTQLYQNRGDQPADLSVMHPLLWPYRIF